jgi:DNA-binding XRE family transcriptional regulator
MSQVDYIASLRGQEILIETLQKDICRETAWLFKEQRKEIGMTQTELGRHIGIPQSNITRFESGKYNPTLEFLVKVAAAMGKKVKISLEDQETERNQAMDRGLGERFAFRDINMEETAQAIDIEQICFPPHEACSPKSMTERIAAAPELFLVAVDKETGEIAGFLNGVATDEPAFRDEFFTDITLHKPDGKNVMLLGLDVLPEYRGQGLAREIVKEYMKRQKKQGRHLAVLTCLDEKVEMYKKMGLVDNGIANSAWGGEQWHEMSYTING